MAQRDSYDGPEGFSSQDGDDGPRVSCLLVGDAEVFVLSMPVPRLRYPEGITEAEREVADLLVEGVSPREIAKLRERSLRTVTTQITEVLRKAGVHSKSELIAYMTKTEGPWTE